MNVYYRFLKKNKTLLCCLFLSAFVIGEEKPVTPEEIPTAIPTEVNTIANLPVGKEAEKVAEMSSDPFMSGEVYTSTATNSKGALHLTGIEFKQDSGISKIEISFDKLPSYKEVTNPQSPSVVTYLFENVEASETLQKSYDTLDYQSPVSLFSLLQVPNSIPLSTKLIINLKEPKKPQVLTYGNKLVIAFDRVMTKKDEGLKSYEENIYDSQRKYSGAVITKLEIKDSDVQDVIKLIARSSGYNVVIGEEVKGKIGSLSLDNIPWDQAFTLVLQTKKLGYIKQGNVIRVSTLENLKSEKDLALANETARLEVESLKTILIPISYAKAKDVSPRAQAFMSKRGKIDVDTRTNTLIIRDVESVVERIQKLMIALDTQPPRVSISARFVEMKNDVTRNLGFSALSASKNFSGVSVESALNTSTSGVLTTTISASNWANLSATLQLMELDEKVKVLANPHLSALNGEKASVTQSESFFVPIPSVVGSVSTITLKEITANLTLEVTPVISGDGSVTMEVSVTNEVPTGSGEARTIQGRKVTTSVLVENGDTAVIGGVLKNTVSRVTQGVPLLMRIPILGFFFSGQQMDEKRSEIVVFLTPKILNPEKAFKRVL